MNLLIAGDYLPTKDNMELFEQSDVDQLFGKEMYELFQNADYSVANLEGVFVDEASAIKKQGLCIKASKKSFEGYKALGIKGVSLANNHSLDFGEEGLNSTIGLLKASNIAFWGVGNNRDEARKPYIIEVKGIKIGFFSMAEHEFTIVSDNRAGANYFDELYTLDEIADLKKKVDYLVVLYHGSNEYYRYPVPYVQARCRRFVDKGADLVLCQHSHCIGCKEEYENGTILYGQGNFHFCRALNEYTSNGLLVSVELPEGKVTFIPTKREQTVVRLAKGEDSKAILDGFNNRSEEIKNPDNVIRRYEEFCNKRWSEYNAWSKGYWAKAISMIKMNWLFRFKLFNNDINMLNLLRCESHRNAFIEGLKKRQDID